MLAVKLTHAMAAAFLVAGLLSGPAVAGVTGAEGGTTTVTEETVETVNRTDNVQRVDTYDRVDTQQRVDNYQRVDTTQRVNQTISKTQAESPTQVVRGHVMCKWWYGGKGLKYGDAAGWRYFADDLEIVVQGGNAQGAINQMVASLKSRFVGIQPGRTHSYTNLSTSKTGTATNTWTTTSPYQLASSNTTVTRDTDLDSQTTFVGRETTFTGRETQMTRVTDVQNTGTLTADDGTIIVGDPDAILSAYLNSLGNNGNNGNNDNNGNNGNNDNNGNNGNNGNGNGGNADNTGYGDTGETTGPGNNGQGNATGNPNNGNNGEGNDASNGNAGGNGGYVAQGNVDLHIVHNVTHNDTYNHTDTYNNVDTYNTVNTYTNTDTYNTVDTYKRTQTTHTQQVNYYQVNITHTISPIVLDLDGDGRLQASGGDWLPHPEKFDSSRTVMFDFNANGFPVLTEWVGPEDGLLVRPYADGCIDGSCLFGSASAFNDGYDALAALDADRNGQLEGAELNGLKVWKDANSNAAVDDGEVLTLDGLGITSIGVSDKGLQGTFVRNGQTFQSFDWWPTVMELRKKQMGPAA